MKTHLHHSLRTLRALGLILLLGGFAAACDDASSELPEKPELSVSGDPLLFSQAGGELTIAFETNRAWTARLIDNLDPAQQPWCSLSAQSGEAGRNSITVHTETLDGDYRQAVLLLNASAAGREIAVMQSGRPVLTTADAGLIDEAAATLGGSWIYSGAIEVAEYGVGIRPRDRQQYDFLPVEERAEDGTFSLRVSDLNSSTDYLFATYLLTAEGVRYLGPEKAFTTDAPPTPQTIADLKAAGRRIVAGGQQTLTESRTIEGVVVATYTQQADADAASRAIVSGEACVMLVDDTQPDSGIALLFEEAARNTFHTGDRLSVRTKEGVLRHSQSGVVDLRPLSGGIRVVSTGNAVEPVRIDHTKLPAYEAMAVSIERTQLTRLFTDPQNYPAWSSAALWNMEVEQSEVSYSLHVPAECALASERPLTGSGTIRGIVVAGDNDDYAVRCERPEDVAGLTGERFESLLELKFLPPQYEGTLCAGEAAAGELVIPYRNGDNSLLDKVWARIEGDPAVTGDLAVSAVTDYRIGTGTGSIRLTVSGTPAGRGTVTFTVYGIEALGTQNACTAEVVAAEQPEVGNFEAVWNTNTAKGDTRIAASSSNPAIAVTDLELNASASNISGTKWADFAAVGWDANTAENKLSAPVQYFRTTITVGTGKTLALSGMDIEQRINGGDVTLSVQYALNGGAFIEIESLPLTSDSQPFTVNLGKTAALKTLAEGTRITIRLVPIATSATIKWGFKKGSRFSVYGNAE